MEIEFKISKEELIDFHMKHVIETTVYKYSLITFNIYFFLVAAGFIIIVPSILYISTILITLLVLFIFRKKIFTYKLRKKFEKIYRFDKYTNLFELTHLSFTEDGIKASTKFSDKIYKWSAIKSLHLIEQYILIRTINNEDLLIPIFSFNPLQDREIFLDTIIKNTELELQNKYPIDIKYL